MANADVNYHALTFEGNPFIQDISEEVPNLASDTDNEDTPQHSGLMIHVVPDNSKGMSYILQLNAYNRCR